MNEHRSKTPATIIAALGLLGASLGVAAADVSTGHSSGKRIHVTPTARTVKHAHYVKSHAHAVKFMSKTQKIERAMKPKHSASPESRQWGKGKS